MRLRCVGVLYRCFVGSVAFCTRTLLTDLIYSHVKPVEIRKALVGHLTRGAAARELGRWRAVPRSIAVLALMSHSQSTHVAADTFLLPSSALAPRGSLGVFPGGAARGRETDEGVMDQSH